MGGEKREKEETEREKDRDGGDKGKETARGSWGKRESYSYRPSSASPREKGHERFTPLVSSRQGENEREKEREGRERERKDKEREKEEQNDALLREFVPDFYAQKHRVYDLIERVKQQTGAGGRGIQEEI